MSDLAGLLYTAKDKIMILRSVKFLPEAASFTYNRLSGNKKMTDNRASDAAENARSGL